MVMKSEGDLLLMKGNSSLVAPHITALTSSEGRGMYIRLVNLLGEGEGEVKSGFGLSQRTSYSLSLQHSHPSLST